MIMQSRDEAVLREGALLRAQAERAYQQALYGVVTYDAKSVIGILDQLDAYRAIADAAKDHWHGCDACYPKDACKICATRAALAEKGRL